MMTTPDDFLCPLSKKVMQEPVSSPSGTNYERAAIEEWLSERTYCPVHGTPLWAESLKANISLQWKIRYWQSKNNAETASTQDSSAPSTKSIPLQTFICPLTKKIMQDPVMSKTGYSFERAAILKWIDVRGNICPMSGNPLQISHLLSHSVLKREIQWWQQKQESKTIMYIYKDDTSLPGRRGVAAPLEQLPPVSIKSLVGSSSTDTKSSESSHTFVLLPKSVPDAKSTVISRGVGASSALRIMMKNACFLPAIKKNDQSTFQRGGKDGILDILDDVDRVLG